MTESQRVVGIGVEEGPAGDGGVVELLRSQFQLGTGREQAGLAGVLVAQPHHLFEGRLNLLTLNEPVELLEITE